MSSRDFVTTVLGLLLGGGGLAFVRAMFRGIGSLRSGTRASERAAIADLAERAESAEQRVDDATYELIFWRNVAGRYAYQLTKAGLEPDPPDPAPPPREPRR